MTKKDPTKHVAARIENVTFRGPEIHVAVDGVSVRFPEPRLVRRTTVTEEYQ